MKQNILNKIKEEKREREIGRFSYVRIIERFPTLCAHSRNDFRRTSAIFVKRKVRSIERDAFPIQKYVPSVVKTTIRARMRIFISPLFYEKMYQNQEKEFPWFCDTVCFRGRKSDGSIHRALAFTRKETINLSIYANKRTCAFLNKPPVEPPKIGDGVFGSNFGADHAGAASPSARTIWND